MEVPPWRNGRRDRLKIGCREMCPFESGRGHHSHPNLKQSKRAFRKGGALFSLWRGGGVIYNCQTSAHEIDAYWRPFVVNYSTHSFIDKLKATIAIFTCSCDETLLISRLRPGGLTLSVVLLLPTLGFP